MEQLIGKAITLDKYSLGRLISIFEDARTQVGATRKQVLHTLSSHPARRQARFIGITGTPGSGKSTLIGELATGLIAAADNLAVAVLAIDPSSHISGGALLGDRTRVRFPADERRLFFRSQASDRELGGVGRATFQVCRLLHCLFDVVLIETVGIGQSEVEVQRVADFTYLVLSPLGGDQIQFMKAGIMEIPDAFIVSKSDEGAPARQTHSMLVGSAPLIRPNAPAVIHLTSAKTGEGMSALVEEIRALAPPTRTMPDKEAYFFTRWVRDEYGRRGLRALGERDAHELIAAAGGYDDAIAGFAGDLTPS